MERLLLALFFKLLLGLLDLLVLFILLLLQYASPLEVKVICEELL